MPPKPGKAGKSRYDKIMSEEGWSFNWTSSWPLGLFVLTVAPSPVLFWSPAT